MIILFYFAIEVEVVAIGDTYIIERTDTQTTRSLDEYLGVDLRRAELRATDVVVALFAIDDGLQNAANLSSFNLCTDTLLHSHEFVETTLLHFCWHIILVMFCAVCAFLLRVGESPHTLEACPFHKLYEFLEVFLCLAREANEQCCAQMQTRHLLADALYELHCLRLSNMAMHTCEHIVGDMLQSDVEILANVRLLTNNVKQFKRELVRISVVQTNPLHTLYICDVRDKVGDMTFAVNVHSVVCQFLSDNLELLHATCHQLAHLLKYLLFRTAYVLAGDNLV